MVFNYKINYNISGPLCCRHSFSL